MVKTITVDTVSTVSVQVTVDDVLTELELKDVLKWYKKDLDKDTFQETIKEFLQKEGML